MALGRIRWRLIVAFAVVYVVWGSTYLFMRFAVESIPPLLLSGIRFLTAGTLLFAVAHVFGGREPRPVPWKGHAVAGILLTAGNACVAVAVGLMPSGVASLLVALTPCLMVLFEWYRTRRRAPTLALVLGLVLGIAGTAVLVGPRSIGGTPINPMGVLVVFLGALAWSSGSIYSRSLPHHNTTLRTSAIQMLAGGSVVTLVALAFGDGLAVFRHGASTGALLSLGYLVLMGSVLGYSAYTYLLRHTTAARVSTYAFVNPVVAVLLGATFGGEAISSRVALAGLLIISAVVLVTFGEAREVAAGGTSRTDEVLAIKEAP